MSRPSPALALAGLLLAAPMTASAAPATASAAPAEPAQRLEEIERAIGTERDTQRRLSREAAALTRELAALRRRVVSVTTALQDSEEQLSALEQEDRRLAADAAAKEAGLAARRAQLTELVSALVRMGRQPAEAVLVLPGTPLETARAARVLGALTPALREQAIALNTELQQLAAAHRDLDRHQVVLAEAKERLRAERVTLDSLLVQRASLQEENQTARQAAAVRLQQLTREAQDIRDLIERLARERAAAEAAARAAAEAAARAEQEAAERAKREALARLPPPPDEGKPRLFSEARGQIVLPARGAVLLSFGQPGEGGQPHRGLTIETRPEARVVAPYDGHIVYAGPFRAYGLILIIEHSEGYHTLLAGLGRIDSAVGQFVAAGEPVGAAGSPEQGNPSIYVELRRNGQPINPQPWLATHNEKVSG